MKVVNEILNHAFHLGKDIQITVKSIIFILMIFLVTALLLTFIKRLVTRKLPEEDGRKFDTIFSFVKYFVFVVVFFLSLDNLGVDITAMFAASAALLIGVGLALQTLFQDIICGIFVLLDKTVHVNDVIEMDGRVFKVTEINLRTTKGLDIENKVLIIPNHTYLNNTLYNWTQNDKFTRESISVGVAYGSDVSLVKMLLLRAAANTKGIARRPEPLVFFERFGESSMDFKLVFTVTDSFMAIQPKSDLHFEIERLFRENNVTIPFPQRDIHIYNHGFQKGTIPS
ncbi:mechanosensitive ion channel protein MscS [Sediminicola luteus]|uniref:Mechanosensitive ion channel protein MscS n=2 Tax=Sediminicola luteus TaxID=319238 RepID=A0A2A4G4T7_9FLAO|nr:mechanosensitive ion channel protein MscS [Sediminicola luteus]